MSILDELSDANVWREFYEYKTEKAHLSRKDARFFAEFIETQGYKEVTDRFQNGNPDFSIPEKKLINKLGTDKKRVVYSFSDAENMVLKLTAFLLYRYDGQMPSNCYSFRREISAKNAIRRMVNARDIGAMYCYKLDIKNYFNSIDIGLLLPMLKGLLADDGRFFDFLSRLLTLDRAVFEGGVIEEKRGVMAGTPISPFLANVFLAELDRRFEQSDALYARYSDDIILFARTREHLEQCREEILAHLKSLNLSVNPEKELFALPGENWEYLGIEYKGGEVDLSHATKRKIKGKISRKARALRRWMLRKEATAERALRVFFKVFNRKFFDSPDNSDFTWARWFFPLITVTDGLAEIDAYMQENARFIVSGKHNKANYRIGYDELKQAGCRSLVNEYFKYKRTQAKE